MKIQNKMPNIKENLHSQLISGGWIPMREPKRLSSAILLSIPFMFINGLLSIWIINIFSSITLSEFGINIATGSLNISLNIFIVLAIFLLIIIHELLHLVFIPNFIKSNHTYLGFTSFGAYVLTEDEISKARYMFITIAPFLIISIILPFVLGVFGILTATWKFLIIFNALGSSVDLLYFILLITKIPKHTKLTNNGSRTYWQKDAEA